MAEEIRLYRDDEFADRQSTTPIDRLKANPTGLRAAINGFCFQCCYSPGNGGSWRQQVEDCGVDRCALWRVRPRSTSDAGGDGLEGTAAEQEGAFEAEAIG